jgi:hypothetical protein
MSFTGGLQMSELPSTFSQRVRGLCRRTYLGVKLMMAETLQLLFFFSILIGLVFVLIISPFLLLVLIIDGGFDHEVDWRDSVDLYYAEDAGWWMQENGTLVEQFGNNTSGLVPGDRLHFGEVPSSHLLERHYYSCWTSCSSYDREGSGDCYTDCDLIVWSVFSVSVGGMEFILDGGDDFMAHCFNAVCSVNATVAGDGWEVFKEDGRVVLVPSSYVWVRWCQGEEVCE